MQTTLELEKKMRMFHRLVAHWSEQYNTNVALRYGRPEFESCTYVSFTALFLPRRKSKLYSWSARVAKFDEE